MEHGRIIFILRDIVLSLLYSILYIQKDWKLLVPFSDI
jgi:hypothetical protein